MVISFVMAASLVGTAVPVMRAVPHPVHAARVELQLAASGKVGVTVRVYRDDFPPGESRPLIERYLAQGVQLRDSRGQPIRLALDSVVHEGDRLRLVMSGVASAGLTRGRLAVTLLQERFSDQVNVAQVRLPGRETELIFLKGDASQVLP